MVVRVQQRAEAESHFYLPRVGAQEVDVFRTEGRREAEVVDYRLSAGS